MYNKYMIITFMPIKNVLFQIYVHQRDKQSLISYQATLDPQTESYIYAEKALKSKVSEFVTLLKLIFKHILKYFVIKLCGIFIYSVHITNVM